MRTAYMRSFWIIADGKRIAIEMGHSAAHALDRYAEGSTYDRSELTAVPTGDSVERARAQKIT